MYSANENDRPPHMAGFDLFSLASNSDEVDVWPENEPALDLFWRVRTQWRVGMGGPTGLDYSAVWRLIDRRHLPDEEADDLFDDVQVMEEAALDAMRARSDG